MSSKKPTIGHYNPYMRAVRALIGQRTRRGEPFTVEFLKTVWPAVVGSGLAEHIKPILLTEDKLVLAVSNDMWLRGMSEQRKRILTQVNHFIPKQVQALKFVIKANQFPKHTTPQPAKTRPLGEVPDAEASILHEMEDEELRLLITRVRRLDLGKKNENI